MSQTWYWYVSEPQKSSAGVYVMSPVTGSTLVVPLPGGVTTVTVVGSRFPSTSVSLSTTGVVTGVSSSVASESSFATGGSFTGVTSIVTVAVSQAPE